MATSVFTEKLKGLHSTTGCQTIENDPIYKRGLNVYYGFEGYSRYLLWQKSSIK
jgi:hypothetical protein